MSVLTPKTAGLVDLTYCVARVQADREDYSDHLTEKATQYAINCFTSMNVLGKHTVECDYFTMDANGIVDLSTVTDFIDYVKVAIPIKGKTWILNKNESILPRRDELDASKAALIFNGESSFSESSNVNYGYQFVNGIFGLGGGFSRSFFRLDREKNQLQFDTMVPNGEILLEYTSTGLKASGATTIPRSLVDYIVSYIHWQLGMFDINMDRFRRQELKQNFLEQENILTAYKYAFDPNEYLLMRYENVKQTPKR
jgi:hypothetical protein